MTTIDYLISAVLILPVSPQIRGTRQTLRNTLLPLVAAAAAAAYYLRSFPTEGHDIHLGVLGVLVGAILGIGCGPTTRVERGSGGRGHCQGQRSRGDLVGRGNGLAHGFRVPGHPWWVDDDCTVQPGHYDPTCLLLAPEATRSATSVPGP
ncbi:hypothetical protein [Streptomyces sp. NPDC052092]|uniref:hypothetical protein n=1 Tax=Streptomyces sp. NPDC052092 TaxID=3365685 RepID=UPI0037D16560